MSSAAWQSNDARMTLTRIEREQGDFRVVYRERKAEIHVPENLSTSGKRDAPGVKRLYVEVKDEDGNVVFRSWQDGPIGKWSRTTLYFDRYAVDGEGHQIGLSLWD